MSQQIQEQLSALMDGELPREEMLFLLRRCESDRGMPRLWSRYHITRQFLRRQESLALRDDFASGLMARIELESAPSFRQTTPWLRWASGGAIAASVAVAALFVSAPPESAKLPGDAVVSAPAATVNDAVPTIASPSEFRPPMLSPTLAVQPAAATSSGYSSPSTPIDPRLQSYLIRHYDAAGGAGQGGIMPYVLLVVPSQQQAANAATLQGETTERR